MLVAGMKTKNSSKTARTPSGTVITQKATDIRGFFENGAINEIAQIVDPKSSSNQAYQCSQQDLRAELAKRDCQNTSDSSCLSHVIVRSTTAALKSKTKNKGGKQRIEKGVDKNKIIRGLKKTSPGKVLIEGVGKKTKKRDIQKMRNQKDVIEGMEISSPQKEESASINKEQGETVQQIKGQLMTIMTEMKKNVAEPANQQDECDLISLRSVMAMFKKMEEKIDSLTEYEGKKDIAKINTRISAFERKAAAASEVSALKKQLTHYKFLTRIQGGTIQRLNDMIDEMSTRMDNLELNVNKKMVTLTNFPVQDFKDKDREIEQIGTFFNQNFGFVPEIDDYFLIGTGSPPTIVISFVHLQEKRFIMQNKTMLKGVTTEGKSHFINEYVPVATNEKRRKERETAACFPEDAVSYKYGKIQIHGRYYVAPVQPPAPEKIVDLSLQQLDQLLAVNIANGDTFAKDDNKFTGYTLAVADHQQINDAYLKLRVLHPRARHIVCAYMLENVEHPDMRGFCDDGEVSAGRTLLNLLQQNNMEKRAVFVVRYFGQNKIGNDRYTCLRSAAISALENHSFNNILKVEQLVQISRPNQQQNPSASSLRAGRKPPFNRNRGRGSYPWNYAPQPQRGSYRNALTGNGRRNAYRRYRGAYTTTKAPVNTPPSQISSDGHSTQHSRNHAIQPNVKRKRPTSDGSSHQQEVANNSFTFASPRRIDHAAPTEPQQTDSDYEEEVSQESLRQYEEWSNAISDEESGRI